MIQHRPPIKQSLIPREQLKVSLKGCLQVRFVTAVSLEVQSKYCHRVSQTEW